MSGVCSARLTVNHASPGDISSSYLVWTAMQIGHSQSKLLLIFPEAAWKILNKERQTFKDINGSKKNSII
jgi:hypothetical protein